MRTALAIIVVAACCLQASAGTNPDCQVCIDFSGTATSWADVQSRIDPEPYDVVDAYICVYGLNGFTGICLTGYVTPGMGTATGFASLLPGDVIWGPWDEGTTLVSPYCLTDRFLYAARISFVYMGTPGDVMIFDHPDYPRWVMDCHEPSVELDYYCVWMHGGVGKDAIEGDEECFPVVPVEDATWGSVKALYR